MTPLTQGTESSQVQRNRGIMVAARAEGGRNGELVLNRDRVSVWGR